MSLKLHIKIAALALFLGLCPVGAAQARPDLTHWATTPEAAQTLVHRLETIDILRPFQVTRLQFPSPTLVVGHGFYRLPEAEQERVLALVDLAYTITPRRAGGLFLEDPDTGKVIGLYTVRGIQWQ